MIGLPCVYAQGNLAEKGSVKKRMDEMKRLEGRVAVVTGSAQGMGLAIAKALGNDGARIVITDVNKEQIDKSVKELNEAGYDAAGFKMDVTDGEDVKNVLGTVKSTLGSLDILVNNAGGALNTPHKLDEIEEKVARREAG